MRKKLGTGFIVLGFIAAGVAGVWLAAQVSQGHLAGTDLTLRVVLLIVPITLLVGLGIFMVARGDSGSVSVSSLELQRQMMDILNSRGEITIEELAAELDVTPQSIAGLLAQLQALGIFAGEVDQARGILYARRREH